MTRTTTTRTCRIKKLFTLRGFRRRRSTQHNTTQQQLVCINPSNVTMLFTNSSHSHTNTNNNNSNNNNTQCSSSSNSSSSCTNNSVPSFTIRRGHNKIQPATAAAEQALKLPRKDDEPSSCEKNNTSFEARSGTQRILHNSGTRSNSNDNMMMMMDGRRMIHLHSLSATATVASASLLLAESSPSSSSSSSVAVQVPVVTSPTADIAGNSNNAEPSERSESAEAEKKSSTTTNDNNDNNDHASSQSDGEYYYSEDLTEESSSSMDAADTTDTDYDICSNRDALLLPQAQQQPQQPQQGPDGISMNTPTSHSCPRSSLMAGAATATATATAPLRPSSALKPAIKPSLKSSSRFSTTRKPAPRHQQLLLSTNDGNTATRKTIIRPSTERRVRGLWNATVNIDCHWSKLRDETIVGILDFLNLAETLKVSMVSQRYRSIVHSSKKLWHSVDATEFVRTAHANFQSSLQVSASSSSSASTSCTPPPTTASSAKRSAQELTGQALESVLERYQPIRLEIRDIQNCLSANSYLPSVASLQELTLHNFEDLTDTHAHVLLLMTQQAGAAGGGAAAAPRNKSNSLRKLALNHCPLLTSASLRSIASQCPSLEALNLQGCTGITSLEPLATLLVTENKLPLLSSLENAIGAKPTPPMKPSMLLNMFGPPPSASSSSSSAPPPPVLTGLASMFGPPATATTSTALPPQASVLSNFFAPPAPAPSPARPVTPPMSPPRDNSPTPASSLQSLFCPPGMSPRRNNPPSVSSLLSSSNNNRGLGMPFSSSSSNAHSSITANMGKLQELNLQGTSVPPLAVLKLFQTAAGAGGASANGDVNVEIALRSLSLDGHLWTDHQWDQLGPCLAWSQLVELSLACPITTSTSRASSSSSSSLLTDQALIQWASRARLSRLISLDLSRQSRLTGYGLAKLLQQTPKLQTLICQEMVSLLANGSNYYLPLMKRLTKLASLGEHDNKNNKRGALRRVDLRGCQLEPLVLELVQSTFLDDQNSSSSSSSSNGNSIQLLL